MLIGFQITVQQYVQSLNQLEIVENANWHRCNENSSSSLSPSEMQVCKC